MTSHDFAPSLHLPARQARHVLEGVVVQNLEAASLGFVDHPRLACHGPGALDAASSLLAASAGSLRRPRVQQTVYAHLLTSLYPDAFQFLLLRRVRSWFPDMGITIRDIEWSAPREILKSCSPAWVSAVV